MFGCRNATELSTEAREGTLSGLPRVLYRIHTTICPHCRAFLRQVDEAIALAKEIPAEEVPPRVEESALEAFRRRQKSREE